MFGNSVKEKTELVYDPWKSGFFPCMSEKIHCILRKGMFEGSIPSRASI